MADFHQAGDIATLHRFPTSGRARLERSLEQMAQQVSIGLVIPALYSEFQQPAIRQIASELRKARYLRHIVIALGRANYDEYLHACSFFKDFPSNVTVLWIDSEPVQELLGQLDSQGLSPGNDGKGRSCWLSFGYLLARGDCDVIALHDADVKNYDREMLARLCYPLAHPSFGFEFAKGYYSRITDRMNGRVTRLYMTPLLRALQKLAPANGFLRFLDSFRYPLSGEFAMKTSLARANRVPGDWGLEIGVLSEVYRNSAPSRICQVDLADAYDHKHQILSPDDIRLGLHRMTFDIGKTLLRSLAAEGVVFGANELRTLQVAYLRCAQDMIGRYQADAALNGLEYDLHCEELAVEVFSESLQQASQSFLEDPLGAPCIPNWNRVSAAIPGVFDRLVAAVEQERVEPALCVA